MAAIDQQVALRGFAEYLCEKMRVTPQQLRGEVLRTCVSCLHFDEPTELCKLCNLRPPARVIANACPQYRDEIPF